VWLLAPQTYMNLSGEALAAWRETRSLDPSELLVVSDDVYLPAGMIRLRARGSSGGHRGLESVEEALGTRDYARLRIGVGHAAAEALREHVLDEFTDDDERAVEEAVARAAEAVEAWLDGGILAAMNRFNRRIGKEVSET
jgi:PTH1 family peptidyl-tRNA hydrolase